MSVLITNNAGDPPILAAPINTSVTTIVLNSGNGALLPNPVSPDFFMATLTSASNPSQIEIVRVTARSTDTLTVVRAQEGTTGQSFNASDILSLNPTGGVMNAMRTYVSLPTSTGAANAQAVANTVPIIALLRGAQQSMIPGFSNTGPCTLASDGLTATAVRANGRALVGGELQAGVAADLEYDGTVWQLLNPNLPGKNFMIDPCCRVAQGAAASLATSYAYGLVDLVQCKATGTAVNAGTITQDTAYTVAAAATAYSAKIAGATITGTGKVFFRRWVESRDAIAFKNGYGFFSVLFRHDVGSNINAFLTLNAFGGQDTPGTVVQIGTGSAAPVSVVSGVDTLITLAVPNMQANSAIPGNGFELILEGDCGAVTTKDFWATDWQTCLTVLPAACVVPRFEDDYQATQRYFEKSYEYGTVPGTSFSNRPTNGAVAFQNPGNWTNGSVNSAIAQKLVGKLVTPTIKTYSQNSGAVGKIFDVTAAADVVVTATGFLSSFGLTNSSGGVVAASDVLNFQWTADARV